MPLPFSTNFTSWPGLNSLRHPWYSPKEMQRRSTLWFILAAAWFALLVVNLVMRHHNLNTLVIGIAAAVFVVIGAVYRSRESKGSRGRQLR